MRELTGDPRRIGGVRSGQSPTWIADNLASLLTAEKLARRADMFVSTLRRYVEVIGGRLEILATFPDGEVRILHLGELAALAR